ncbi:MAG: hypothetical protein LBI16_05360, partial [Burkholderiales bacterium]|nr:hypothetical protein [Burkholderiales bacterium]
LGAAASQSNDDHNRYASKGCAKKGSNYIPDSIRSFDLTRAHLVARVFRRQKCEHFVIAGTAKQSRKWGVFFAPSRLRV